MADKIKEALPELDLASTYGVDAVDVDDGCERVYDYLMEHELTLWDFADQSGWSYPNGMPVMHIHGVVYDEMDDGEVRYKAQQTNFQDVKSAVEWADYFHGATLGGVSAKLLNDGGASLVARFVVQNPNAENVIVEGNRFIREEERIAQAEREAEERDPRSTRKKAEETARNLTMRLASESRHRRQGR